MPAGTIEETTAPEKTELTRTRLADLKAEQQRAKNELSNFEIRIKKLEAERESVGRALTEAETTRSELIARDDSAGLLKTRKELASLKARLEEIQETLPVTQRELDRRANEVNRIAKETRQVERSLWVKIGDELRENQPPQLIEFFERLYACMLEGVGPGVQLSSLLAGIFPKGIHPDRVNEVQDQIRKEFGF